MWDLGEYQKYGIWASTRNVGSGRVPKMVGSGRVLEMWDAKTKALDELN